MRKIKLSEDLRKSLGSIIDFFIWMYFTVLTFLALNEMFYEWVACAGAVIFGFVSYHVMKMLRG
jgi:hypothetical protein